MLVKKRISKMKKIMNIMNSINYGYLDNNNKIHNSIDESFSKNYILQTPQEVFNNKIGVCWDQVELERELFNKENINFKTYFIVNYDNDKCPTHTFLIYESDNKYYWFEHSWEKYRGIHSYTNENEALLDIKNKFIKDEIHDYNKENISIFEYQQPKYGIKVDEFYKHCEKGNKR